MKKITIITMQLKTPGGIERFVSTLAEMFADDFEVELVANYGKDSDVLAFPLSKKVKVNFLTPDQPKEVSMKNLVANLKWSKIPGELKRRKKINGTRNRAFNTFLKNLQTDYIITDRALYNSLVSKFYRGGAIKIATDHNYHQNDEHYIKELLESISGFDHLVLATEELRAFYATKTSVKCHAIQNPLEYIPTKKSDLSTKNLVSVGRFVPEKDFESLVDVMALVHEKEPDAKLTIIGDGVLMPQIKNRVAHLGLEDVVILPGALSQKEIEKYFYDSALFVMTSRTEAFGLVLTEAMSYGLPCIAFDRASGARNQINEKIGVLVKDADTEEMAKQIVELLGNQNELKTYQDNISDFISDYSKEQVKKSWFKIVH